MTATDFRWRVGSLSFLLFSTTLIPPGWINAGMYATVHVHFLLSYLYQYRGKKMNTNYRLRYLIGTTILLILYFLFMRGPFLEVFSGLWFLWHFYQDELHLLLRNNEKSISWNFLLILWAHIPALALRLNLPIFDHSIFIIGGFVLITCSLFYIFNKKNTISMASFYLSLLSFALFFLVAIKWQPYIINQFRVIIIYHVWISYILPFLRATWPSEKKKRFFQESILMNMAFFILGIFYYCYNVNAFRAFFSADIFNFAACLHFISTTRWAKLDFKTPELTFT